MKNYEEMAQSVLKRRDIEIKRRKRAFLIGAPCAAAALVGVVGIGVFAASQDRDKLDSLFLPGAGTAVNNNATDAIGHDPLASSTTALPEFPSYTTGNINTNAPEIAIAPNTDMPEIASETNIDLPVSTVDIETAPAVAPADNATGTNDIAVEVDPPAIDYTNPNAGEYVKVLTYIDYSEPKDKQLDLDENDFTPYTLEQLDPFYGLRFNRLAALYPEWTLSYDKLGVYRHETSDGVIASMEIISTLNTLNYTTENGGTVSVSAQYGEFEMPMIGDQKTTLERRKAPWTYPEVQYEYDADGNIIGASTPPYDPTASSAPAVNTDAPVANAAAPSTHFDAESLEGYDVVSEIDLISNPENSDLFTQINGYDALVLAVLDSSQNVDHYVAYINMSSHVRIIAYGVTQFEFEEILDNFTK